MFSKNKGANIPFNIGLQVTIEKTDGFQSAAGLKSSQFD